MVAAEQTFHDPFMAMYYYFLDWVLPKIVGANEYFQNDKVVITYVDSKMKTLYSDLLLAYMRRDQMNRMKLELINPADNVLFLPLNQMYIGINVLRKLQNDEIAKRTEDVKKLHFRCRPF